MRLIIAVIVLAITSSVGAADPTTLPRLQSGDVIYLGYFNLPSTPGDMYSCATNSFGYGSSLGLSADGASLYVAACPAYDSGNYVARVSIPSTITDSGSSPASTLVQGFTLVPGGVGGTREFSAKTAGMLVSGSNLLVNKRVPYDGAYDSVYHLVVCSTAIDSCSSPIVLSGLPGPQFAAGYLGNIPSEWQSALGGAAFAGNSFQSINSANSNGPSFFVFDPTNPSGTTYALMYYEWPNVLMDVDLYDEVNGNDWAALSDFLNAGIVFPSGTRSVLFFSRHGTGPHGYKTGDGECGEGGGEGNAPYRRQITAFDATDLKAVKDGTKNAGDVEPYAQWTLPTPTAGDETATCTGMITGGLAYDAATRRVYLAMYDGGYTPRIQVYQIVEGTPATTRRASGGGTIAGSIH